MGKRKEVAFEEKVSLVEEYLAGRLRMWSHRKEGRAYELFRCAYLGEVHADH